MKEALACESRSFFCARSVEYAKGTWSGTYLGGGLQGKANGQSLMKM